MFNFDGGYPVEMCNLIFILLSFPNGHGKGAALNNETRGARFPLSSSLPQAGERDRVSLREFHVNGHGKCAALNNETCDARFPLSSSLPQAGERDRVSLREFHVNLMALAVVFPCVQTKPEP